MDDLQASVHSPKTILWYIQRTLGGRWNLARLRVAVAPGAPLRPRCYPRPKMLGNIRCKNDDFFLGLEWGQPDVLVRANWNSSSVNDHWEWDKYRFIVSWKSNGDNHEGCPVPISITCLPNLPTLTPMTLYAAHFNQWGSSLIRHVWLHFQTSWHCPLLWAQT